MQGKVSPERSATTPVYVGIDVCKERLDVHIHPLGLTLAFANSAEGIKRLKRSLKAHEVALVAMEATGKFHRAAHRSLHADGFAVAVVNPLRSRLFAEAMGALAKTDRVDCRMLAILGESLKPGAATPQSELMETLQELTRCRDAGSPHEPLSSTNSERRRLGRRRSRSNASSARLKRRSKTSRRKSRP